MARSSNDDRSDSMNPNNDSYWASESNRDNQIGDDDGNDTVAKPFRSMREAPPIPTYDTYAIAVLTYEGKGCFVRFSTVNSNVPSFFKVQPRDVAQSVWELLLRWMSETSKFGIAYARIWGPDMRNLPALIWNAPGRDEAYWNAPERLTNSNLRGFETTVLKARSWFTIVERANRYERALEMLDHSGCEDLGLIAKVIDYNLPNPLLDM